MLGKKKVHVLVVEDDKDTVEIVSRALLKDYQVTMCLTMEEALQGFDQLPYGVVVTDIFMPGMGGIEGIKKMREIRPEVKILATSAGYIKMSSEEALKAAKKIGADAILPKPFSLDELRSTVAELIGDSENKEE